MKNPISKLLKEMEIERSVLAIATGLHYQTIANIEYGYPASLRIDTAKKLAEYFKTEPQILQDQYTAWRKSLAD